MNTAQYKGYFYVVLFLNVSGLCTQAAQETRKKENYAVA